MTRPHGLPNPKSSPQFAAEPSGDHLFPAVIRLVGASSVAKVRVYVEFGENEASLLSVKASGRVDFRLQKVGLRRLRSMSILCEFSILLDPDDRNLYRHKLLVQKVKRIQGVSREGR